MAAPPDTSLLTSAESYAGRYGERPTGESPGGRRSEPRKSPVPGIILVLLIIALVVVFVFVER